MVKGFLLLFMCAMLAFVLYLASGQSVTAYNAWVSVTSQGTDVNGYPIPSVKTKLWGLVNHPTAVEFIYYGSWLGMGAGLLSMVIAFITDKLSSEDDDESDPGDQAKPGKRIITEG